MPPTSAPIVIAAAVSDRLQPRSLLIGLEHDGHRDIAHAGTAKMPDTIVIATMIQA